MAMVSKYLLEGVATAIVQDVKSMYRNDVEKVFIEMALSNMSKVFIEMVLSKMSNVFGEIAISPNSGDTILRIDYSSISFEIPK